MMVRVAPSILSADFSKLGEAVQLAERAGADLIHVDIMDGHFVPNLTLGPQLVAAIRRETGLPIDVHLMVERPREFVPLFHEAGADWISIHVEATAHLNKDLNLIRSLGRKAGAALNPATPVGALEEVMDDLDYILIMSVNPGWGGQSFIPSCLDKIRRLHDWIRGEGRVIPIEVDGGIKLDNAAEIIQAGMDVIVAGSAVFASPDPAAAIRAFKDIARKTA
jgi:ribulose-phosphate 3-epimerase